MSRYERFIIVAGMFAFTISAPAQGQPAGKKVTACALLSGADIKRIAGRSDLATSQEAEDMEGHSNCIHYGAIDIGVTIASETKTMFERMRDQYSKAPARLGYTVERISGVGDDAYFLIDKDRVELKSLVGEQDLTVALTKISMIPGQMPPEPEAKAIALSLAKAVVAKLR